MSTSRNHRSPSLVEAVSFRRHPRRPDSERKQASLSYSVLWGVLGLLAWLILPVAGIAWALPIEPVTPSIAGGGSHTMALKDDGTVWTWGANWNHALGRPTVSSSDNLLPGMVPDLDEIIDISGGDSHSIALQKDGTVWGWGDNGNCQIADGGCDIDGYSDDFVWVKNPLQIDGLSDAAGIGAGYDHTIMVTDTGTVKTWGANFSGQLGRWTDECWDGFPGSVSDLDGVAAVVGGNEYSVALKVDGTVWVWGDNGFLQSEEANCEGYGGYFDMVSVDVILDAAAAAAGWSHTLVLTDAGTVWSWGSNSDGQLGRTTSENYNNPPAPVPGLSNIVAVAAGGSHSLALANDGRVWAWGNNASGQLGIGTNIDSVSPVPVPDITDIVRIAAGDYHSIAVQSDGTVWGWGYNGSGQLGNRTNDNSNVPVRVSDAGGEGFLDLFGLSIDAPDILEGDANGQGEVRVPYTAASDLTVNLSSDDDPRLTVPPQVTIIEGGNSVEFELSASENAAFEGPRTVTLTARFAGSEFMARNLVTVVDNETAVLTLTLPETAGENAGKISGTLSLSRPADGEIPIHLDSGDSSEISVSDTVSFPENESSVGFDLTIVDDADIDGHQTVTITAEIPGLDPAVGRVTVLDNDFRLAEQSFSGELPTIADGWEFYSSNTGRIELVDGRIRMDTSSNYSYSLNEAVLTVDLAGYRNVILSFFQAEFWDGNHELPASFTGHEDGDGVAVSADGETWYTIVSAADLDVGSGGKTFTIDLDAKLAEIESNLGVTLDYTADFKIKFQQYGNYAYSSDGREWDDISVTGAAQTFFSVLLPESIHEGDTVLKDAGILMISIPPAADLTVDLTSDDSRLDVPDTVVIQAGQTSVAFDLTVHDNDYLEGPQPVSVSASTADIQISKGSTLLMIDDETAELSVVLPESIPENAGTVSGAVTTDRPVDADVSVSLSIEDEGLAGIPPAIVIPEGESSAAFEITIPDNTEIDGSKTSVITASVTGWNPADATLTVTDDETRDLILTVRSGAVEGDGLLQNAGTVSLTGTFADDLVIELSSDDTDEAAVPDTVTIPAGDISADFDITVVEDGAVDGNRNVTISAAAPDWMSGEAVIRICDLDGLHIPPFIATGYYHSLAVEEGGTVWAWGENNYGRLGDGTSVDRPEPVELTGVDRILTVSGGGAHTIALRADGTVWTWGSGSSGQLGNGSTATTYDPSLVESLSNMTAAAAGGSHSLAVNEDGSVWAWGGGNQGQLGDGISTYGHYRDIPVQIAELTDITAVAAGDTHSLALQSDGSVWAWGDNYAGKLGDETYTDKSSPVQVFGLTDAEAVSAGLHHSLALQSDGTVWAWGYNRYGQLGLEHTYNRNRPYQVKGISDVVSIACGSHHSLALKADGTVWAWGLNSDGQLGDGTTTMSTLPVQVPGLKGIIAVASGLGNHSLALKSDGTVYAWGANSSGQLGDGTKVNSVTPVQVIGDSGSVQFTLTRLSVVLPPIAGEGDGSLTGEGTVTIKTAPAADLVVTLASGDISELSVPDFMTIPGGETSGTFDLTIIDDEELDGTRPVTVSASAPGFSTVTDDMLIEDNETASLTITLPGQAAEGDGLIEGGGTVTVVGAVPSEEMVIRLYSSDPEALSVPETLQIPAGQESAVFDITVGDDEAVDGTQTVTVTAEKEGLTSGAASIDLSDNETRDLLLAVPPAAIEGDGQPYNTGRISITGTFQEDLVIGLSSSDPAQVVVPETVTIIKGERSVQFELTLLDDGVNDGRQTVTITASSPEWNSDEGVITVHDLEELEETVPSVATGSSHSLAIDYAGNAWGWGSNWVGELNLDGSIFESPRPAAMIGINKIKKLAGGDSSTIALRQDGTVWGLGLNEHGMLGNGTTEESNEPIQIQHLSDIIDIAAGEYHALALKADGTVWAWGRNEEGQLGNGVNVDSSTPVQVQDLTEVISISAGYYHSMALKNDGSIWMWGANESGELGNGNGQDSNIPVQVVGLYEVTAIASGGFHSLAVQRDGSLWAWGWNDYGQLGDGTEITRYLPVKVFFNATSAGGGWYHSIVLCDDGTVWSSGYGGWGQLGDGTKGSARLFVKSETPPDITAVSSGYYHSLALKKDGTVWAWGDGYAGQIGIGDYNVVDTPTIVTGPNDREFLLLQPLWIDVPEDAAEGDEILHGQGTIVLKDPSSGESTVTLHSADTEEVRVAPSISIPDGQFSGTFDLEIVDDTDLDGSRRTFISASLPDNDYTAADTITVHDNETAVLTVELPDIAGEGSGSVTGSVTVSRPVDRDVAVNLSSNDLTEVTVPDTVTILAGRKTAEFPVTIMDDYLPDDSVFAVVTASVSGWTSGTDTISITDNEITIYSEDFSADLPDEANGWTYYSSGSYGRIRIVDGRLRMDVTSGSHYTLNEAVLTVDLTGFENVKLNFFHADFDSRNHYLPETFTGHKSAEGVSISSDGETWHRIIDTFYLLTGETGETLTIDLDAAVARIQTDYPDFGFNENFKIKFQQYDNYPYPTDGREWDDISLTTSAVVTVNVSLPDVLMEKHQILKDGGTITVSQTQPEDRVITLFSGDTDSIRIPETVTLPADGSSVTFDIETVDDTLVNGHREVTVTASLPGTATGRTSLVVIDDETAAVAFEDNEDNSDAGSADADMGRDAMACVANTDAVHPIEFGIEVKGDPPVSDAFLLLTVDEAAQPERSEVFLNGRSLGMILGGSPKKAHHWFLIPDLSRVETGTNRIRIDADLDNSGDCLTVYGGQFVFDGASSGIASIRTAESDADVYAYGDSATVTVEADTILHAMNVRMALTLLDSTGAVLGIDTDPGILSRPISLNQNEPHQWTFTLPNTGADGIWGVAVGLHHADTGLFLDSAFIPFKVGSAAAAAPFIDTLTPDALIAGEENHIVIRGGNFLPEDTQCSIGDYPLGMQTVFGATLITGIVTDQLDPGEYTLQCTTSEGAAAAPVQVISGLPVISDIRIGTVDLVNDFENGYVLFGDRILTFTVTSTSGIETVEVLLDGAAEAIQPDTDSEYSFPLTPLPGAHRLEIHATDSFGRQTAAAFDIARETPLPFACFQECIQ